MGGEDPLEEGMATHSSILFFFFFFRISLLFIIHQLVYILVLYKENAKKIPHSSILVWRILWTEEPGRLRSIGLQRVGQD